MISEILRTSSVVIGRHLFGCAKEVVPLLGLWGAPVHIEVSDAIRRGELFAAELSLKNKKIIINCYYFNYFK